MRVHVVYGSIKHVIFLKAPSTHRDTGCLSFSSFSIAISIPFALCIPNTIKYLYIYVHIIIIQSQRAREILCPGAYKTHTHPSAFSFAQFIYSTHSEYFSFTNLLIWFILFIILIAHCVCTKYTHNTIFQSQSNVRSLPLLLPFFTHSWLLWNFIDFFFMLYLSFPFTCLLVLPKILPHFFSAHRVWLFFILFAIALKPYPAYIYVLQ